MVEWGRGLMVEGGKGEMRGKGCLSRENIEIGMGKKRRRDIEIGKRGIILFYFS